MPSIVLNTEEVFIEQSLEGGEGGGRKVKKKGFFLLLLFLRISPALFICNIFVLGIKTIYTGRNNT